MTIEFAVTPPAGAHAEQSDAGRDPVRRAQPLRLALDDRRSVKDLEGDRTHQMHTR